LLVDIEVGCSIVVATNSLFQQLYHWDIQNEPPWKQSD
jgi:hypothetical protein